MPYTQARQAGVGVLWLQVPNSTITLLACNFQRVKPSVFHINVIQAAVYSTKYFTQNGVKITRKTSVEMQLCRSPAQTKSNPCNTSVSYGTISNLTGKGSGYPHKPDAQSSKVMFVAANPLLNFSDPATIYITNFNSKHLCILL